ncbi:uncharacterized protein LOC130613295 [Hydractinia symbiolongicarpus]|uniref:uncharacterized protein LOC130613295 n=1 Tax=Hydractinia symbiolongicarpus TaxID=13093 RepID=UPI00254F7F9A|nr:uncharacterized protein LOC130613295 [Hydractinia symbiolongicarpus]
MYTITLAFALFACAYGLEVPDVTGPTPPPVPCPNSMCSGQADGNYNYDHPGNGKKENYFVQCVGGKSYCQACWPKTLKFKKECNQCMYSIDDPCYTTKSWIAPVTYTCPDECPSRGPTFQGNIADPAEDRHFVACWNGVTVGCVNCPAGLLFNEYENACLYEGKYLTKPSK